jgi:general secretion pathway protein B
MSFILDALRKSENDRQGSAPAEFTTVASGGDALATPRWLWVLGGLLLVNAVVLAFLLLRTGSEPVADAAPATPPVVEVPQTADASPATAVEPSFSVRVAEARRDRPVVEAAPKPQPVAADPSPAVVASPPPVQAASATPTRQTLLLPTLTELRTNGTLNLPDMHLDIHVYSGNADDRFVFINMSKYRERSKTKEGPVVSEITAEGVVLDYQGTTFLLPRD